MSMRMVSTETPSSCARRWYVIRFAADYISTIIRRRSYTPMYSPPSSLALQIILTGIHQGSLGDFEKSFEKFLDVHLLTFSCLRKSEWG